MNRCMYCPGERVAYLVRLETKESPEKRIPICRFHTGEFKKDLDRGTRWDGTPVPEGWEIQK